MPLDWSNERYVRLYTRETTDQAAWCWQARALWPWLLTRVDGAGVIETRGVRGLAAAVRLPVEVVEAGLSGSDEGPGLLEDGCVVTTPRGYAVRNFVEAQNAQSSANRRQAAVRERDRAIAALTAAAENVTATTEVSHAVTPCHAESRAVTPCHSDPIRSDPNQEEGSLSGKPDGSTNLALVPVESPPANPLAEACCRTLSELTGSRYSPDSELTARLARSLSKRGVKPEQVEAVVRLKVGQWKARPEMASYLRPATLLSLKNFLAYAEELQQPARPNGRAHGPAAPVAHHEVGLVDPRSL